MMQRQKKISFSFFLILFVCSWFVFSSALAFAGEEAFDDADFLAEFDADIEEEAAPATIADPLEPVNRVIFVVNDKLYFWVLKPAATGWNAVVPRPARIGMKNFFRNIAAPVRILNQLLQFKGKAAAKETGKFFVNSIWGFFGLFDAANQLPSLQVPPEDLGQTLGYWGIGNGCYLVLPFFGPSTLRNTVGFIGDANFAVTRYLSWDAYTLGGVLAADTLNKTSFRLGDYEAIKAAAFDPYTAVRDGYIQIENKKISE